MPGNKIKIGVMAPASPIDQTIAQRVVDGHAIFVHINTKFMWPRSIDIESINMGYALGSTIKNMVLINGEGGLFYKKV